MVHLGHERPVGAPEESCGNAAGEEEPRGSRIQLKQGLSGSTAVGFMHNFLDLFWSVFTKLPETICRVTLQHRGKKIEKKIFSKACYTDKKEKKIFLIFKEI